MCPSSTAGWTSGCGRAGGEQSLCKQVNGGPTPAGNSKLEWGADLRALPGSQDSPWWERTHLLSPGSHCPFPAPGPTPHLQWASSRLGLTSVCSPRTCVLLPHHVAPTASRCLGPGCACPGLPSRYPPPLTSGVLSPVENCPSWALIPPVLSPECTEVSQRAVMFIRT